MTLTEEDFFSVGLDDLKVKDDQGEFSFPEFFQKNDIGINDIDFIQYETTAFYSANFDTDNFYHFTHEKRGSKGVISSFANIEQTHISDDPHPSLQTKSKILQILHSSQECNSSNNYPKTLNKGLPFVQINHKQEENVETSQSHPNTIRATINFPDEKFDIMNKIDFTQSIWDHPDVISSPQIASKTRQENLEDSNAQEASIKITVKPSTNIQSTEEIIKKIQEKPLKHYSRGRNFRPAQKEILVNYILQHLDDPYVTAPALKRLEFETGLSEKQIRIFLTNYRSRNGIPTKRKRSHSQ